MTDLERSALLGDQKAQEECTRQGILLPCPFCGNKHIRISNWGMWRCWCPECLGKSEDSLRERDAVKHWNTRPAPPVGWISVEERLPDDELDGETVLAIVCGNPHENITLHSAIMTAGYFNGEGWVVNEYPEWEDPTITNWMPLPEPPKEAGRE